MKIAISSTGKDLDSNVSAVFGRCPFFVFVDMENKKIKAIESISNISAMQSGGAGISAAQRVAEKNAEIVITGNIGPRALSILSQLGIKVFSGSGNIREVINLFLEGKLKEATITYGRGRHGWH